MIHTDDLLEKLDRALSQPYLAPALTCGLCKKVLKGTEASLDFCGDSCQLAWQYRRTDGLMDDEGRWNDPACLDNYSLPTGSIDAERQVWLGLGLGRAYDAYVMFCERERTRRQAARVLPDSVLSILADWLGVDPDS